MIGFQILFVPLLCLLAVREIVRMRKPHSTKSFRLFRATVWGVAAVLVYQPELTSLLASRLGIQRGADLVIYLFMIVAPLVVFHLYAKLFALQRSFVVMVRHDSLQNAVAGEGLVEDSSSADPVL